MRYSIRRLVIAVLACAFVATVVSAPVMACDGKADSSAESSATGK